MLCSSNVDLRLSARGACAAAFSTVLLFLVASPAAAQTECVGWVLPRLLDTSDNCVTEPWRELAKGVETFSWKGQDYLMRLTIPFRQAIGSRQ